MHASPDAPLRRTPLYDRHAALGGRLVPFAGWELPIQYAGITHEHRVVREAVGIFDVSHMGELVLEGPGAEAALDGLVTNAVRELPPGRALYTVACNAAGTILDDLIVYRIAPERWLVVCNASNRDKMSAHFAAHTREKCAYADRSDAYALLALQGPRAHAVMTALGGAPAVLGLAAFGVATGDVAGAPVIAARTGYTGEDGYELFVAPDHAPRVWDALLDAGRAHGIEPIGLGARDTLRLEARLMLYGNDIDETTNPYEANLGWVVKLDKGDFLGRDALVRIKREGTARRLVGFEMVGRGIARHGHAIVEAQGSRIGVVTSGAPGLTVGKNIGLGYVPRAVSEEGTRLGIEIRDKIVDAVIVKTPFYRRAR